MEKTRSKFELIVPAIIIAALLVGGGFVLWQRNQPGPSKEKVTNAPVNGIASQPTATEQIVSIGVGYKNVRVSDGTVTFSFDVPEKRLVETRHSGEKQLTTEEMRDFLSTSYWGDIKTDPKLSSDYIDQTWSQIKNMSPDEINKAYLRSDYPSTPFPNASVAAGDYIQYTDTSWQQVDLYLVNDSAESAIAKKKQEWADDCKEWAEILSLRNESAEYTTAACGGGDGIWSNTIIDSKNVDVYSSPTGKDENGNELISKDGSGGKTYFVEIPNLNETLVISKQAKGDVQFEKDFDYLIQTFKFE